RRSNAWGVYDMHGNVWEWVEDWYQDTYEAPPTSQPPSGLVLGASRVLRGGSWQCTAGDCRSASRHAAPPDERAPDIGFRLLRDVSYPTLTPTGTFHIPPNLVVE